jgi:hypothetical protein
MRQSAVLADEYVLGRNELEAEIQELREQNHRLRLAMEQAATPWAKRPLKWVRGDQPARNLSRD